jgi:hypothetical protein
VKILALGLIGLLLVATTTATRSADNNGITNTLFQIAEAQLTDNSSNNNANVSLVSQRAYNDADLFHIVGEVQNTGTEAAEFVQIVASFYNENDQFVGTSFTYTTPNTVSSGTKAPFDIQLLTDDKIVKESKSYQLTLSWTTQDGKEMVKQYNSADLRQGQGQQQSSSPIGSSDNTLSQTTEATTTTTDISFGAKALQFLTYCNNQFSQTSVNSIPIDTLVFCTMVYDWYYMGCNNNTILTPIIAAQCKDPVIIQLVNKYRTEIDIRIKQIIKIVVPPPRDGGGDGNDTGNGNDTNGGNNTMPIFDTCMGGPPGIDGCPPEDGGNETTTILPIISPPIDPCIENPNAEGCPPPTCPPGQHYDSTTGKCVDDIPPIDPCIENPNAEGCLPAPDPCIENPNAEGCEAPLPPPPPPSPPIDDEDTGDTEDTDTDTDTETGDTDTGDDDGDGGGDEGGDGDDGGGDEGGDGDDGGGEAEG